MTSTDDRGAAVSPLSETSSDGAPPDPAWLRAAIDGSSDALAVMAADTTLLWMSAGCTRLIGFQPAEMVGRSMVDFLHPDDLERAVDMVGLATAGLLQGDRQATPACSASAMPMVAGCPLRSTRAASTEMTTCCC